MAARALAPASLSHSAPSPKQASTKGGLHLAEGGHTGASDIKEGVVLIWLEADVTFRRRSIGKCHLILLRARLKWSRAGTHPAHKPPAAASLKPWELVQRDGPEVLL